jgi:hypothetical protein
MSESTGRNVFIGSWVLAFIMIAWASFHKNKGMPQPVQFIKASAVWTILGLVSEAAPKLAGIMGMGLLIPLFFIAQGGSPNAAPGTTAASASGAIASGVITGGI